MVMTVTMMTFCKALRWFKDCRIPRKKVLDSRGQCWSWWWRSDDDSKIMMMTMMTITVTMMTFCKDCKIPRKKVPDSQGQCWSCWWWSDDDSKMMMLITVTRMTFCKDCRIPCKKVPDSRGRLKTVPHTFLILGEDNRQYNWQIHKHKYKEDKTRSDRKVKIVTDIDDPYLNKICYPIQTHRYPKK